MYPSYPEVVNISHSINLQGRLVVGGAKTAAVPILAASILVRDWVEIANLPDLLDVHILCQLIECMGGEVEKTKGLVRIRTDSLQPDVPLPMELISAVHSTLYLVPAILGRFGRVSIANNFGGCKIGDRPIEHVLGVLRALGADVAISDEMIWASAPGLKGTTLSADPSAEWDKHRSGATKAALILGACADGITRITSAYTRSSITELASFLRAVGADISGDGTPDITIRGRQLTGGRFAVAGDYLEALTYIALVAACRGDIEVIGFDPSHCEVELRLLSDMGVQFHPLDGGVRAVSTARPTAVSFSTASVDTDIQPIISAALTLADGDSIVEERVWEDRFRCVNALSSMGAKLRIDGRRLLITGVPSLVAAHVHGQDLRAGAALLLAASAACGTSTVGGLSHLKRGYQDLLGSLQHIGVKIDHVS
jgi:UDP-N-acetylglucosamine 1-carboxyvinyltransferase